MALLFMDGFDKYGSANSNAASVAALLSAGEWTTANNATFAIVAPLSAAGQSLQATVNTTGALLTKTLAASYSRLIGGIRFTTNLGGSAVPSIVFFDSGTAQASIAFNATGTISVRNGITTVLGTTSSSISAGSVHYLEWDITFGNSAAYQVWLDGVSVLSSTGDTTTTSNNTANQIGIQGGANSQTLQFDDFYLFDSSGLTNNAVLLTSPRIDTTFPASDSAVQFTAGPAILGSNAQRTTTVTAPAANSLVLRRYTPVVAATLNSISIVAGATNAGAQYRGVAYADSGGAPGTLMSSGATQTGVTSGVTKDLPLTTPQTLAAGVPYWLGFMCDTSVNTQQSDTLASGYRANATFSSGAPGTAPAMTSGQASFLLWGNLTGVTGNNWYMAAQQPVPGALSYVFDATVNHEDLYGMSALSATPATVHAVALKGYVQKSDSGAKTVSLRIKSGSTDSGGSSTGQAPATSFGWLTSYFIVDPDTSSAWTGTGLNAATAGIKVDS